jgi:hypothetical protein
MRCLAAPVLALLCAALSAPVLAQHAHGGHGGAGATADARAAVPLPPGLKAAMLANMRDHLLALQQIQQALAAERFDEAATLAERRLGMSSMADHGAHEVARYMPQGMREAGTAMHRSASRLAGVATDAAISRDLRAPLGALAELTATCVACHAAYRLE